MTLGLEILHVFCCICIHNISNKSGIAVTVIFLIGRHYVVVRVISVVRCVNVSI